MASASVLLAAAQSVVVKVGSSLLVDERGSLRDDWLSSLAADIVALLPRFDSCHRGLFGCGRSWRQSFVY